MNTAQALSDLLKEYPVLAGQNARIVKQFVGADGRSYNTFLVETDELGFEKFIAKSFVHNPGSLRREWMFLKMLQDRQAPAPRLLIDNHEPEHFLLMEYVDGITSSAALTKGYDAYAIFKGIGKATGMANSIELETFGNVLEPTDTTWKAYVLGSLNRKTQSIKPHVTGELFVKIEETISETRHVLDDETKGAPVLVHHDIYLENFLIRSADKQVILIDYGIAYGGRPLFDLAKFYIWDLVRYPEQKDTFLKAYSQYVKLPKNFNEIMKFYLLFECCGMIAYFEKIKAKNECDDSVAVLVDIVNGTGDITKLIS